MKFAQTLATHVTPEWRSQYIDYDLMKEMLYQAILSLPAVDTDEDGEIQGDSEAILAKFNQEFFTYADKELAKVNTFFAEKLSEALRKFATLKNALKFFQFREEPGENGKKFGRRMVRPNASTLFRKSEQEREMSKQYKKVNDLKLAFSEFYLSLVLLQNYQNLNYQGFRKIMKKHDKLLKITTGTDWRSRNVDSSPFYADKEIDRLITEVENLVTNELEKGDRTKAMKRLRVPPLAERTTSWDFFRNGFVSGSFLILMTATIVSSITHGLPKGMKWLDVVRLYRGLFLLIAFTFLAGINVNGWAKAGVNHVLIFELDPRTHLSHHNMLEIAGVLANLWCITFLGLIFSDEMHIPGPVWPLILLGTMIVFMILPFKVFFYESRTWLLKRIWIVFTAPFHYVTFADFWLADQLNSLVLALRDIQFLVCFYIMEVDWLQNPEPGSCTKHTRTYGIRSIIAVFPAWIRFAQCLRRYRDTRKSFPHLVNAGKYATSFFVVLFSTLDAVDKELSGDNPTPMAQRPMFYLWVLSAVIGSCYGFAWDVKMDWGFFDLKAAPSAPLLREDMVYNSRWFYYFAIVEDFILRYAWVLSITVAEFESHFHEYLLVFMGLFELFRRFIWNFFRLENEHLNNCGQFRAVRDISIAPIKKNDLQLIEEMMDTDNGVFHRTLMYPVSAAKKYRAISKPELMEGISNEQIATTYLSEEVRTKLGVPEGPYKPPVFKRPVFGLPDPNSTLLEEEEDEDSNLLKKDE